MTQRIINVPIGDTLYTGADTTANIQLRDANAASGVGEIWWSTDELMEYHPVSTVDSITGVAFWKGVKLLYDGPTDTYKLTGSVDGQTQNLGQEVFFTALNNSTLAATVLDPKVFRAVNVTAGTEQFKNIIPIVANDVEEGMLFGLNTTESVIGASTKIIVYGDVKDVNTAAWPIGSTLYLDLVTAGDLTLNKPISDALPIAYVIKSHATEGILFVNSIGADKENTAIVAAGFERLWFTGDVVTPAAGTFYQSGKSAGTVTDVNEVVTVADNSTEPFLQDWLSDPITVAGDLPLATYSGQIEFQVDTPDALVKIHVEVYLADVDGNAVDSGSGLPNGTLGQPPIVLLESTLLSAPAGVSLFADVSGSVLATVNYAVDNRTRYRVLAEKVGTDGPSKQFTIYGGTNHDSYVDVPYRIQASDVITDNSGNTLLGDNVQTNLNELDSKLTTDALKAVSINQVAHGFTIGQSVVEVAGVWQLALTDTIANSAEGVVGFVTDADNFFISSVGKLSWTHGLVNGEFYYLDKLGVYTITAPSTIGDIVQRVFKTIDTNTIYIDLKVPSILKLSSTGLELVTETLKSGWRLVGKDPLNYGDTGTNAVDISESDAVSGIMGATGDNSYAQGLNVIASGVTSHAQGEDTIAVAAHSHAEGLGTETTAPGSHAAGTYNDIVANTIHTTGIGTTDLLRANVWELYTTGEVVAPSITNALIDNFVHATVALNGKILTSKEYVKARYVGYTPVTLVTHGLDVGDSVVNITGAWQEALTDVIENSAQGIIMEIIDVDNFLISNSGSLTLTAHGYIANTTYYLDDVGNYVNVKPTAEDSIVQEIFRVIDVNTLQINIQDAYVISSGSTIPVNLVAHGFVVEDILGQNDLNAWVLADEITEIAAIGVVTEIVDVDNFILKNTGIVPTSLGLGKYYLELAGALTTDETTVTNLQHCLTVIEVGSALLEFGDLHTFSTQLTAPILNIVSTDSQNDLTFTFDGNATSHVLQVSTDNITFADVIPIYDGTSGTYSHTGLTNGQLYYYRMVSIAVDYLDSAYGVIQGTPDLPILVAPIITVVEGAVQNDLTFTFDVGATSSILESSTDNITYAVVAPVYDGVSVTYSHTGLVGDQTYYYRMVSSGAGYIDSPAVIAVGTPDLVTLAAPVMVVTPGSLQNTLDFTFDASATSSVLESSTDNITFARVAPVYNGSSVQYIHTGLVATQIYYYRMVSSAVGFNDSLEGIGNGTPTL